MRKIILTRATLAFSALVGGFYLAACSGDDTTFAPADGGATHDAGHTPSDATNGTDAPDSADATSMPQDGSQDAARMDAMSDASVVDGSDALAPDGATASDAGLDATASDCLTASGADSFFTLADATKCVVAAYTVPTASLATLTWGRQGGPLGFESTPTLQIVRYAVPASATGTLTATRTPVAATGAPAGVFWGSQALDLPFFPTLGWTAISYTGGGAGAPGEVVIVDGMGAIANRYNVNGFFAETAVGLAASGGRLLYTGLSPLMSAAAPAAAGGLYAADACGTDAQNPRLLPAGDATCKDSFQVATWQGGSSGPVAVDADGNAFAILSTFGGSQEMRGFEHDVIARGAGATAGTTLVTTTGYTSELAADGKAAYFQPNDGTTFTPLDVQAVKYTVDTAGKTLAAAGAATTFLTMKKAGTAVALIVDDSHRLWVGVTNLSVADAGATTSTFFVIRDKTP